MRRALLAFGALVASAFMACRPDIDDDPSRVAGPRVLAVRVEPPEARPGEAVDLVALYTDGSTAATPSLEWSLCSARRPLAEPSPIDPSCLPGGAARAVRGAGPLARATVPRDACRTFGPDRPLGKPGEPAGRPADPDGTGGFYQPGLVGGAGAPEALFEVRVRCGLPSATQAIVAEFERRYRANTNTAIAELARVREGGAETLAPEAVLRVARSEHVHLRVAWSGCPDPAAPCGGAERYVGYDTTVRAIADRREAIQVSWLTTAGTFASPRTGRDEGDLATISDNDWTSSPEPARGSLFVVLRDSRGGASFRSVTVIIE